MTREMLMHERFYHDEVPNHFCIQYILLTDEVSFAGNTLEIYGVKIKLFQNGDFIEQKALRGVTPFGTRITAMLNLMADSLVTPVGMADVVTNLLGS
ncbi:MAG: hypothetical protein HFG44_04275 [Oscillospiraceae bacterium]|jgi:hypothetical protein|nr:hypothetical protein [Oscillospiraceae bacterium]